jgi:S-adenosylmethionine synthetase
MEKRNIFVERIEHTPIESQETEFVERKGLGHPDSIADALAETVSRNLAREYLRRFGRILHYNTDEVQIVGGLSAPKFGDGTMVWPIYILLVGRATTDVGGEKLPVGSIAINSSKTYLKKTLKHLDVYSDVILDSKISMGSAELRKVFESDVRLANDTSFGVGYAPMSETEKIVYQTEKLINGKLKKSMPELGEDVKVMGTRKKDLINLTVAVAMIGKEIPDLEHYISAVEALKEKLLDNALKYTNREVSLDINTADNYKKGIVYLTVTGLSMENGDDGSVGRGNRVNGVIAPYRPMSIEAHAGKNPVTHVGKLYNILAFRIAEDIVKLGKDIKEAHVRIVSQIGKPIDKPNACTIQLIMEDKTGFGNVKSEVSEVANEHLANIYKLTDLIVQDKIPVFL